MTPEERIVALEVKVDRLEATVDGMDKKIDELLGIVAFGRGAGWFILKLGAFVGGVAGVAHLVYINFIK